MNKNVSKQINENSVVVQFSKSNPRKVLQPIPTKTDNISNVIDYKNIPLSLTGEISSISIDRNGLTQKRHDTSFIETVEEEEDDEQFISDMKKKIDQNYKLRNNENYSIRDLQSKSYLEKKRRCLLSDEDQNLMKRFKRSVNESKDGCVTPQKLQFRSVTFDHNMMTMNTLQITPAVSSNNINTNSGDDVNRIFCQATSMAQGNKPLTTSEDAKSFVTEAEIKQLYCEMQCFTPPEKNN